MKTKCLLLLFLCIGANSYGATIHVAFEGPVIVGVYNAAEFGVGPLNGAIVSGKMIFDSEDNSRQSLGPLTSFILNVEELTFQADPLAPHPHIANSAPWGIVANSIRNDENLGGVSTTDILNFQAFGSTSTFPFTGIVNELELAFQDETGHLITDTNLPLHIDMSGIINSSSPKDNVQAKIHIRNTLNQEWGFIADIDPNTLTYTPVPLPSSIWLFLSASLFGIGRGIVQVRRGWKRLVG